MRGICTRSFISVHCPSARLGSFVWLAAVSGGYVLYRNFVRDGVDADAVNIVALVVLSGVLGAKLWHELQDPGLLKLEMQQITHPGWSHAGEVVMRFLEFMRRQASRGTAACWRASPC